jgi:chromosome segregation ATPase
LQTEIKELEKVSESLQKEERENTRRAGELRKEIDNARLDIDGLDSQAGQQLSRVQVLSKDAATAWKWIQDNQDEFQEEVYGPALISCSIKDERYTAAIESCLSRGDFLAFTAQNSADFTKLQAKLTARGGMQLGDITLRQITQNLAELNRPPLSRNEMQQHGLQGWAIDFMDGPEPVLAMLCGSSKVHACGITLADVTEQQHNMLVNNRGISGWVTGKQKYQVNRRAEYGPQATSTTTKDVVPPRYWTDAPVDSSAKRDLDSKIESLTQQVQVLKVETLPKRERIKEIAEAKKALVSSLV